MIGKVITKTKKMQFDGYNSDLNFVVEYVSLNDTEFEDNEDDFICSVSSHNLRSIAEKLQKQIKKEGKLNAVVFYDPVANVAIEDRENLSWDEMEVKGKEKSKELLIQQVTDFIVWLKKEKLLTEN